MKKIFRLIAAIAATTAAFSCMEEANPETGNNSTRYEGPMTTIQFSLSDIETRTAWDGKNHTWEEGDQIKIIYGTETDAYTVAEVVDGTVTAKVGDVETYYAVYPAKTAHTLSAEGEFTVTIPKIQDGTFRDANIMAAKTTRTEMKLAFKNLTHILKFELSEGCEYNLFRFYSNSSGDDIRPANTPSVVTFTENDVTVGIPANNGKQSGYVVVKGLTGVGPHYLGVRAGTDYEGGFGVLASKNNSEASLSTGTLTTATLNTVRGEITNLGVLDTYLFDDFYIKKGATGSGRRWSDAAGIDLLKTMLKYQKPDGTAYEGGNGTTKHYRYLGVTIHIAAGEYALSTGNEGYTAGTLTNANITVIGGYPADPTDDSTPAVGENGSETVFTTDGEGGPSSRIFVINKEIGNLTFKNISFKKAAATAAGVLLRANENAKGNLSFDNCYFSAYGGNGTNHGMIRIEPSTPNVLNAHFTSCKFVENDVTNGATMNSGVFFIKNSLVNFDKCLFKDNTAVQIADINATGTSRVFINRTLFQGGHTTVSSSSSWIGTSIQTTSTDTLCVNNCVFDSYVNDGSSRRQPVIFSQGYHYLINSSIYSNTTQNLRVTSSKKENTNYNNVIVNSNASGHSIVQSNNQGIFSNYNLLSTLNTGGNYTSPQEFDTVISASDITFAWSGNDFTWSLLNDKSLTSNMKKADLETKTVTNFPTFDAWLRTIEEDPYGIDFNGNKRNAEKLNPGAWDPGL